MKQYYIFSIFLTITPLFSSNLTWVDEQIQAIKSPRVGISQKDISKIKNPFIFLHKKSDKKIFPTQHKRLIKNKIIHFTLNAIFNKSAMINRKWYRQGSYISGYKITKVNGNSVILTRKNKKILLSTQSKSERIKIYNTKNAK